jgi:hypothetical protein
MKFQAVIVVFALACLSGVAATGWSPSVPGLEPRIVPPAPDLPSEVGALSGVWEAVGDHAMPSRLVIENLHEHWATVLFAWGDDPAGKFTQGIVRATAKVLANGRLFVRQWRGIRFTLSDDWTTLVGTRDDGDRATTFLMRRAPSGVPRPLMAEAQD